MNDVTRILSAIEQGDPQAAEQLLPLVYDELRKLAAQKLAQEKPGQTLQATALVHEAYLRLVGRRDRPGTGTAAATSSPPPPRPCAASWSRAPGASSRASAAAAGQRLELDDLDVAAERPRSRTCSPWTRPSTGSPREDPQPGRAGQAPLLRRPDHRARRPRSSASPPQRPTATGLTPGPGCFASSGDDAAGPGD